MNPLQGLPRKEGGNGMLEFISALKMMGLLSVKGFYRLISAIHRHGANIMALLDYAREFHGRQTALIDDHETLDYSMLFSQSETLSLVLEERYHIQGKRKVAFLCKNHASLVKAIFAVSRLGANIYLLNAEMSPVQFQLLSNHHNFDFLVYDNELHPLIEQSGYSGDKLPSYHDTLPAVNNLCTLSVDRKRKLKRTSLSNLVILTGGTTGNFKTAVHKPSLVNFLSPYIAMLTRLKLTTCKTAYIAVPIYHGYGLATLFLFISLGKKILIHRGFSTEKACELIHRHQAETVVLVPLMVYKMMRYDSAALESLTCIASGGSELNPKCADEIHEKLGDVLYNLYGTSESGLTTIAAPQDLRADPHTIGRRIPGVRLKIRDMQGRKVLDGKVGCFCVKTRWSMRNKKSSWIFTGDTGYRNSDGLYFLCGRIDDMIVSAGENVYPAEVERILASHPEIAEAAVAAVRDENFGWRLKAFILPRENAVIAQDELLEWLRDRAARFQMPREIVFVESMPYTPLGKLDRKRLTSTNG
jgi:acyl-CoA synthetase (AMP-forming)/AMP-acid ligase II